MNWVDFTILAIVGLSLLVGLWRGLIGEVLALVILVAAFVVTVGFGDDVATGLAGSVQEPWLRVALGYGLCFVVVLVLGALLRFVLRKLVKGAGLGGTDHMLGLVFGLVRGVLLVVVVVFIGGFTPFPAQPWWQQSKLLPGFALAAEQMGALLPSEVRQYVDFDPELLSRAVKDNLMSGSLPVPASSASAAVPATSSTASSPPDRLN